MRQNIYEAILQDKIIAIVRGVEEDRIVPTVEALWQGGIRLIEITLIQGSEESIEESCRMLRRVTDAFGKKVLLGAGTVMDARQVDLAAEAGAEYIISPHMAPEIIHRTRELGKISIPGALTPTEAADAYREGADFVKLFPGGIFGIKYLKALRAPLGHIPFLAVGNISMDNVRSYLDAGAVGVGIGGELINRRHVADGAYEKITETAKEFVRRIKE